MEQLQLLDVSVFRFINLSLSNPAFNWIMPWLSWNPLFYPAVALVGGLLLVKGGVRGRLCFALLVLTLATGEPLVWNSLKHLAGRLRPFNLLEANVLVGKTSSASMPSAHATNWFAATMVSYLFYPRSLRVMLSLAVLIGFSRVYNGVHYPGDVLAGALLGLAYGGAMVCSIDALWRWSGPRWFPLWSSRCPSIVPEFGLKRTPSGTKARADAIGPGLGDMKSEREARKANPVPLPATNSDQHWLRLGYVILFALLVARLIYLAAGKIELSEDEAYQWLWSKHLALSYYSKPPLIAYAQWLGTHLWGDTAFGVRFLSPVIAAVIGFLVLRFLAREGHVRTAFWMVPIMSAAPLLAVGSILLTIDPLSVLFWTAAMITGWQAVQRDSTRAWVWTGVWIGLGFLSKYTALFQLMCWVIFLVLYPPARRHLKRPGPYLSLGITALCAMPGLIWNAQHDWITLEHMASRGGLDRPWQFRPNFILDFFGAELALLNPVFFVAMVWAAVAIWRRSSRTPLLTYLFCMGAPLFLFYALYTLRARVQPNWIAPSVVPLFCVMALYWESRWREGVRPVKRWLAGGLAFGLTAVVLLHDTNLLKKIAGQALPASKDPLRRVRAWKETARVVGEAREQLLAEGKPVFIIGDHYGITSLLSFYLPEARTAGRDCPLVYYRSSEKPENQFYFWPGYESRRGQNAIYVQQDFAQTLPRAQLLSEFYSVTDVGVFDIGYRGRIFRKVRLFACRDLR